jgi:polysaccharide biosynthesis protein PslG
MGKRVNIQRRLLLAAVATVALSAASSAQAARFGFADDAGKYAEDGGAAYFSDLRSAGGTENRITVHWDPDRPLTILDEGFLDRSLPVATAKGIRVVFHVYPLGPTAITAKPAAATDFADFLTKLARAYPQVREYVVGNEPNQPRFWRPQYSPAGRALAAPAYVDLLAKSYDALKDVDPAIRVIGLGLSGRGNDIPFATSNASTSPVRFLRDLGAAYRASGRTLPLMDELGLHLYPRSDRDSVLAGDRWPRAGLVNLARLKQAFWDAFAGTGQPTVEGGLKLRVDEIGWQATVPAARRGAYHGRETAAATSESAQAANYAKAIALVACDRSISALYLLHLRDDPDLERYQSGIRRADGSARPAYAAVRTAVAKAKKGCTGGKYVGWKHANGVLGGRAKFGLGARLASRLRKSWGFNVTAAEESSYVAAVFPAATPKATVRRLASKQSVGAVMTTVGRVRADYNPRLRFPLRQLSPGRYVYAVRLRASMNPRRSSMLVSGAFVVR